jgi:ATP-binding cassette, subfamily A (ABC1), member 3
VRSLKDGLAVTPGHDIVGFITNGMGGDVANVIGNLTKQVQDAGKTAKTFNTSWSMAQECRTNEKGVSPCYGAVVFLSSPTQGTNESRPGTWNYTIRGQGSVW